MNLSVMVFILWSALYIWVIHVTRDGPHANPIVGMGFPLLTFIPLIILIEFLQRYAQPPT